MWVVHMPIEQFTLSLSWILCTAAQKSFEELSEILKSFLLWLLHESEIRKLCTEKVHLDIFILVKTLEINTV